MKARKRTGQSKSPMVSSLRRLKRKSQRRDPKSTSSTPESVVSASRRSASKPQPSGNASSLSDVSSISSRRSVSKGKTSSVERSCSTSPLSSKVDESKTPKRSSRVKILTNQGSSNLPSNKKSDLTDDNGIDGDLQEGPALPDSDTACQITALELITDGNSTSSDPKSKNESPTEGRRTSSRQRKPSWRVNFDPSEAIDEKLPAKPNSVNLKVVKTSSCVMADKQPIKKAKLDLPDQLSPGSTGSYSDVPNGGSLLMISSKRQAVPLRKNSCSPISKKLSGDNLSLTNGSDSVKEPINDTSDNVTISVEPNEIKLNGSKEIINPEIIDITDEVEEPTQSDVYSRASCSPDTDSDKFIECCCMESSTSEYNLQVDAESAETFANDFLSDKEDSHLPSELFCQAVDLVGSDKVGCYRVASDDLIVYRVSQRCPFRLLCPHHTGRLKLHQCCPICGYFCTHGPGIMLCTGSMDSARSSIGDSYKLEPKWTSHLFHKKCVVEQLSNASIINESDDKTVITDVINSPENKNEILTDISCPHCGANGDIKEISLTLRTTLPVSIPFRPPAKRKLLLASCRNTTFVPSPEDNILRYVEDSSAENLCKANEEAKLLLSESSYLVDTKSFLRSLLKDDLAPVMASIIRNKSLVNARFKSHGGQSALHLAVTNRNICLVHGLVIGGANPNVVDDDYITPLMLAAKLNEPTLAKYLIASGADKFHKDPNGMNVIHISAASGNLLVLQGILEDHPELLQTVDNSGMTALMHGAKNARTEVVNYLASFWPLETNVRAVDCDKNTPLHWAAASGAVQAVSVLLKHGAEVNFKNNSDETPLHWAVAHGRDGSVLTLLVNQAEISLTDLEGKTPLDLCTDVNNKSSIKYKKIVETESLWNGDSLDNIKKTIKQCLLQTLMLRSQVSYQECQSQLRIVSKDISRGKEPHNIIQCVNSVDESNLPENFKYITASVFSCKSLAQPIPIVSEIHYCSCDSNFADASSIKAQTNDENATPDQALPFCLSKTCSCSVENYDVKERLFSQRDQINPVKLPVIKECNQLCGCDARLCCNRVVQRGSKCELQVFRTNHNGWGVKTLGRVPRGAFVCTYEGEIIDSIEASARMSKYDDSYMFDLYGGHILLDSTEFGNVARFINHSCSPNLVPVKVLTEHQDLRFPHIAFFAKVDIQADEEICFDYGPKFWAPKLKEGLYCVCRTDQCCYRRDDEDDINGDDEVFSSDVDDVMSDSD